MMKDFYLTEDAVGVSPVDYIRALKSGNSIGTLIDLRNKEDYDFGHLRSALNIPAAQMSRPQLLAAFRNLPKDKPIITYCYSSYCMLSIKVGKYLAENNLYVKHLNVGAAELVRDFPDEIAQAGATDPLNLTADTANCPATGGAFGC